MKMKKIFAMLMLVGAVAVVATSCKKDEAADARDPFIGDYVSVIAKGRNIPEMGNLDFTNLTFKVEKDGDGFKLLGTMVNPNAMGGGTPIQVSLHLSNLKYTTSTEEGQPVSECVYKIVDQFITVAGTAIPLNGGGKLRVRDGKLGVSAIIVEVTIEDIIDIIEDMTIEELLQIIEELSDFSILFVTTD